MEKRVLNFHSDGVTLCGQIFFPGNNPPYPLVILSHGLSGIASMDLPFYVEAFLKKGLGCFIYDHRNWGRSSGWPRCETDPWRQDSDMREAISCVRGQREVDRDKIGLWGTSYSGGHVITVGALDKRVACVVSQVPLISGSKTFDNWVPKEKREKFMERLADDLDTRSKGGAPQSTKAAVEGSETYEWVTNNNISGDYRNEITLKTFDLMRTYEPNQFVTRVAPTPIALVVADSDTQTPTDWQLESFERMSGDKKLYTFNCRHYDVYMGFKQKTADAAADWFTEHLAV